MFEGGPATSVPPKQSPRTIMDRQAFQPPSRLTVRIIRAGEREQAYPLLHAGR